MANMQASKFKMTAILEIQKQKTKLFALEDMLDDLPAGNERKKQRIEEQIRDQKQIVNDLTNLCSSNDE
jgi:signal recognition particle GTPase